ncbi:threonine aldolase family protein [Paracoccus pacificus]|uniref:L-threonine aldolase n=1 Tax=Paracoccus pacificus TaxID=1463598 RepID=A0ABW4R8Y9_9RHOB
MNFVSDNCSAVHPSVMEALVKANTGFMPSYGDDALTREAEDQIRELFEAPNARVAFVATGTAANALCCAMLCPPWGRVFCHKHAHIETSEAGAPEFYTGGAKLALIGQDDGRITPDDLAEGLITYGRDNVHAGQNAMLSLTNATEWGTIYAPDQVAALAAIAHEAGLAVHMDGARFANAVAALGCSPADLTWRAGVDALSFGGTKNGCMAAEAVILFNGERVDELDFRRMRGGHLWSKHRYLAAQMAAWTRGGLWLELAGHANRMAALLGRGLAGVPGVTVNQPVQSNSVFATLPQAVYQAGMARDAGFRMWPATQDERAAQVSVRLVASWATTEQDVQNLLAIIGG